MGTPSWGWISWNKPSESITSKLLWLRHPASSAQQVAECLVKAGVKAILNYAPVSLAVPQDVHVQYIDPVVHLQRMTYYLE